MKTRCFIIMGMMLFATFSSCKKDQELNKEPEITEVTAEFYATHAIFAWTVDYPGKIHSMVEISRDEEMSDAIRYGSDEETNNKEFSVTANDLTESTQYYYRYLVWNPNNHFKTKVKHFTTNSQTMPTVVTLDVTDISSNSATFKGEVTDDGEAEVTERGVCWGISHNPDITGNHACSGTGIGTFTIEMTGLTGGKTCYVRAYATNSKGTSYGAEKSFCPIDPGAVAGLFTVNYADDQVFFSQGNLQYQASTRTWRFAEQQYDFVGNDNSNISSNYDGWIDLFGWGTSGWYGGANCYQPWSTNGFEGNYYPGGSESNNLTGDCANADWGVYNAISNGGNMAGQWRTLTASEWVFLLVTRQTSSGMHFAMACVNNICGLILFPDDWDTSYFNINKPDDTSATFYLNYIEAAQWPNLEQHGAVFLPAAGRREETMVMNAGGNGYYWSASKKDDYSAKCMYFSSQYLMEEYSYCRAGGLSVRLVRPVLR